jgi:hypothetical protein
VLIVIDRKQCNQSRRLVGWLVGYPDYHLESLACNQEYREPYKSPISDLVKALAAAVAASITKVHGPQGVQCFHKPLCCPGC